jgi:hypothetical protein
LPDTAYYSSQLYIIFNFCFAVCSLCCVIILFPSQLSFSDLSSVAKEATLWSSIQDMNVQILVRTPAILTDVFRKFAQ